MAMRCFARARFGAGAARAALRDFRELDLGSGFAGDFFCAAVRAAALDAGFCLAINLLPFMGGS